MRKLIFKQYLNVVKKILTMHFQYQAQATQKFSRLRIQIIRLGFQRKEPKFISNDQTAMHSF